MPAHETRTSSTSTSSTSASDTPAYDVCPVDAGYGATAVAADPGYTHTRWVVPCGDVRRRTGRI